jgi:hypothetical protein
MPIYKFFIKTDGHIDKIMKPVQKYKGRIIVLKKSFIEQDFETIKDLYDVQIDFKTETEFKKFIKYIQKNISTKYDFFLYS